jgi:hypothetical protein
VRKFSQFARILWVLAFALSCQIHDLRAEEPQKRKVSIAWTAIPRARSYELKVFPGHDDRAPGTLLKSKVSSLTFDLFPGIYSYHIRAIDRIGRPGHWSALELLVVNAKPPKPIGPDKTVVRSYKEAQTLELKWSPGIEGSKYVVELSDARGVFMKRQVTTPAFTWRPFSPGVYRWRAGFDTPGGEEWGSYSEITVEKDALVEHPQEVPPETESASRPGEVWLLARVSQSVVAYSAQDQDSGQRASGAAMVGIYSAELRARARQAPEQPWSFSGSLNFEAIRQIVLGTDFFLPRVYARAVYGKSQGHWRLGPMLQLNANACGIFVVDSATTARQAKVFRFGTGLGGAGTYQASPSVLLSLLGLLRVDSGGSSPGLPNPLQTSLGYEMGFGTAVNLSSRTIFEGRARAIYESYSWRPQAGGTTNSSLNDLYIVLDVGLGFKL